MQNQYNQYDLFPLTVFYCPIAIIKQEIELKFREWWGGTEVHECLVDLNLVAQPPKFPRSSDHFIKLIIWEPPANPGITCLFVNLADGYRSLSETLQRKLKIKIIRIRLSNLSSNDFPMNEFYYKFENDAYRIVYSTLQSKWEFYQFGPPLPFERTEVYSSKKLKDRVTTDLINHYMNQLGFEIERADFYSSKKTAFLFKQLSFKSQPLI